MGTNKCASQAGMSAYGTRRHLYDPKAQIQAPLDSSTISLQMGTNKGASQVLQRVRLLVKVSFRALRKMSLRAAFIPVLPPPINARQVQAC